MTADTKHKLQLALLILFVVASIRTAYVFYMRYKERVREDELKAQHIGYSNPDYYVNPKKLYPYDLKSANQLTQQPDWVKEGYRYTYYAYNASNKRVDFGNSAGLLGPIEKVAINDVVLANAPPGAGQKRQVMAVFQKAGQNYAVPIGYQDNGEYKIYSDEMFFVEDPHDLYKHWPRDVWQAVEQHQVKPGMNEMQADFAIGMGVPDRGDTDYEKTVRYPNGGKPLVIIYHDGKAAEIKPDTPAS